MSEDGEEQGAAKLRVVVHYAVSIGDDALQIRTSAKTTNLRGATVRELFPSLMTLLDGAMSEREIIAALADRFSANKVRAVIKALCDRGLVEEVVLPAADVFPDLGAYDTVARYHAAQAGDPYAILGAIRRAHVLLVSRGPSLAALASTLAHAGVGEIVLVDDGPLSEADVTENALFTAEDLGRPRGAVTAERLIPTKSGVKVRASSAPSGEVEEWRRLLREATFAVVVEAVPNALSSCLGTFNEAALAEKRPWTSLAFLSEDVAQVGPTVVPHVTACHCCLVHQMEAQTSFLVGYPPFAALVAHPVAANPTFAARAVGESLLTIEVLRALSPGQDALSYGKILTIDLRSFEIRPSPVLKVPRCPSCGPMQDRPKMRIWSGW